MRTSPWPMPRQTLLPWRMSLPRLQQESEPSTSRLQMQRQFGRRRMRSTSKPWRRIRQRSSSSVWQKNRLMQFYNPSLYKPPAKTELSAQQRIAVNMGSEAAPTVAPSGISGTGITYPSLVQISLHDNEGGAVAPPPPPETWGAYQKKGQEQSGVVAMMDLLVADLDKEMTEMDVNEKDAQAEYETFMENSREKRAADSRSIADKEGVKAELESQLQKMGSESKATLKEGMATAESLKDLHLTCDWLLSNFEMRKGT